MANLNEKTTALATHVGCEPFEIEYDETHDEFYTSEGTFRVMDENEAILENQKHIRSYIDEYGFGEFSEWLEQRYQCVADDYFDQGTFESNAYDYVYEKAVGLSDDELIQECFDRDIITADKIGKDGEYTGDLNLVEELSESYQADIDVDYNENYVRWFVDTYGMDDLREFVRENPNCLDIEAIAEMSAETDGYGHNLAGWDGKTNELNGLFIFKQDDWDERSAPFLQSIKSLEKKETEIDR